MENYFIVFKLIIIDIKYLKEFIIRFSNLLYEGRYCYVCMIVFVICKLNFVLLFGFFCFLLI